MLNYLNYETYTEKNLMEYTNIEEKKYDIHW